MRLTSKEFIEKATAVHGYKYDYSKVDYVNSDTKVCIICPVHGEFWQRPWGHLYGHGCKKCGRDDTADKNRLGLETFIIKARQKHGDKYDYSKVEYVNSSTKVCIVCPEHGEFWQVPSAHLSGCGCMRCGKDKMSKQLSSGFEDFIKKSKQVHGDKYDYSKVEYVNNRTKVCIICPEHGEFLQTPHSHTDRGSGCPKCAIIKCRNSITKTFDDFVKESKNVHGNRYTYSKECYRNTREKTKITCPEHGEFWQTPHNHLNGAGCPKCAAENIGNNKRMTIENFIKRAREIHGDKYDYSKVEYVNISTNVRIICPKHGEFLQTPSTHLYRKSECPKCSNQYMDREYFIECATKKHNGKYDYSKVDYKNNKTKVCIICPEHGEFWQTPHSHLSGNGCPTCGGSQKNTTEGFIEIARSIHGDKYDYSKVIYKNSKTKVCIICPEHGEFWQEPNSHLNGRGCPKCKMSKLEKEVMSMLEKNNIEYIHQYHNNEIFGQQSLDFYIPELRIGIECQGEQHFIPVKYRSEKMMDGKTSSERLEYCKRRDYDKRNKCEKANIRLIYYFKPSFVKYFEDSCEYVTNCVELLNKIKLKQQI